MKKREFFLGVLATVILVAGYLTTAYLENSNAIL